MIEVLLYSEKLFDNDDPITCPKCKELESSSVGYNDRGDPIYRAPLGRMQSEDEQ